MANEDKILEAARDLPKTLLTELAATLLHLRSKAHERLYADHAHRNEMGPEVDVTLGAHEQSPWSPGDAVADLVQLFLDTSSTLIEIHRRHADRIVDFLMSSHEGMRTPSAMAGVGSGRSIELEIVADGSSKSGDGRIALQNSASERCEIQFHVTPFEGRIHREGNQVRDVFSFRDAVSFHLDDDLIDKVTLEPDERCTVAVSIRAKEDGHDDHWPFQPGVCYRSEIHIKVGGASARVIPLVVRVRKPTVAK